MNDYKMGDIVVIINGKHNNHNTEYIGAIGIINHIYDCIYGIWFGKEIYSVFVPQDFRKATNKEISNRKKEIDAAKAGIEYRNSLCEPLNLNIKRRGENAYVKH